jgi:serine/threonine protein kinase
MDSLLINKRHDFELLQGIKEFISEVDLLSHLHHKHLVKLVGYHASPRGRLLIYDLIPNGSVESHLHGKEVASLAVCFPLPSSAWIVCCCIVSPEIHGEKSCCCSW